MHTYQYKIAIQILLCAETLNLYLLLFLYFCISVFLTFLLLIAYYRKLSTLYSSPGIWVENMPHLFLIYSIYLLDVSLFVCVTSMCVCVCRRQARYFLGNFTSIFYLKLISLLLLYDELQFFVFFFFV